MEVWPSPPQSPSHGGTVAVEVRSGVAVGVSAGGGVIVARWSVVEVAVAVASGVAATVADGLGLDARPVAVGVEVYVAVPLEDGVRVGAPVRVFVGVTLAEGAPVVV